MNRVIFCKYNNTRRPEFATRTAITEDEAGERFVVKSPLYPECAAHIKGLRDKYDMAKRQYKNARVLDVTIRDETAVFPYLEGRTAAAEIESHLHNLKRAEEKLREFMDVVGDYHEGAVVDFEATDDFVATFGETSFSGSAVVGANIDEIPDNFITAEEGLVLFDYEWTFPFAIPVRYIRFRTVYYFFVKHRSIIERQSPQAGDPEADGGEAWFLSHFGFDDDETRGFKQMEDRFQEYVHGPDRCFLYPSRYEQTVYDVNHFLNDVPDVAGEHDYLVKEMLRLGDLLRPKNYPKYLWERVRGKRGM